MIAVAIVNGNWIPGYDAHWVQQGVEWRDTPSLLSVPLISMRDFGRTASLWFYELRVIQRPGNVGRTILSGVIDSEQRVRHRK